MIAYGNYFTIIQYNDLIGIFYRRHTLSNDDLCGMGQALVKARSNFRIGSGIHRTGGIVKDQNLRFFQQRSGNAKALFLPAGNICTALLDISIIALREGLDKTIGFRQNTGLFHFFIGSIFIAPTQVILNRTGKQHVFL